MADLSHLTATENADNVAKAQIESAQFSMPPSIGDAILAAYNDNLLNNWIGASKTREAQYTQSVLDQVKQVTGEHIYNPVMWQPDDPSSFSQTQADKFTYARARLKAAVEKQAAQPDGAALGGVRLDPSALDDDRILKGGIDLARKAHDKDVAIQAVAGWPQWFAAEAVDSLPLSLILIPLITSLFAAQRALRAIERLRLFLGLSVEGSYALVVAASCGGVAGLVGGYLTDGDHNTGGFVWWLSFETLEAALWAIAGALIGTSATYLLAMKRRNAA